MTMRGVFPSAMGRPVVFTICSIVRVNTLNCILFIKYKRMKQTGFVCYLLYILPHLLLFNFIILQS